MGRKKRPASTLNGPPAAAAAAYGHQMHGMVGGGGGYTVHHHQAPPLPTAPANNNSNSKRHKSNIESYLVKKYRPSLTSFKTIDAFQRYTKTHRMNDASFTAVTPPGRGATPNSPIVFSIIINGQSLSWGRGKNKDVAIDNACRAAFALVAAHGYEYDLNEDCLMSEPMEILNSQPPPPPPPPPLPVCLPPPAMGELKMFMFLNLLLIIFMLDTLGLIIYAFLSNFCTFYKKGGPPLPPGLPPPPVGTAPPLPPPPASTAVLIPQPKAMVGTLASATVVSLQNSTGGGLSLSLEKDPQQQQSTSLSLSSQNFKKKKIKGGLTLIYDAEQEIEESHHGDEKKTVVIVRSMEERRSVSARYGKVMDSFWEKRKRELSGQQ